MTNTPMSDEELRKLRKLEDWFDEQQYRNNDGSRASSRRFASALLSHLEAKAEPPQYKLFGELVALIDKATSIEDLRRELNKKFPILHCNPPFHTMSLESQCALLSIIDATQKMFKEVPKNPEAPSPDHIQARFDLIDEPAKPEAPHSTIVGNGEACVGGFGRNDKPVRIVESKPEAGPRWVQCPICGEKDMSCEYDDGKPIINCVNLACGSNGGKNFDRLKQTHWTAEQLTEAQLEADAINAVLNPAKPTPEAPEDAEVADLIDDYIVPEMARERGVLKDAHKLAVALDRKLRSQERARQPVVDRDKLAKLIKIMTSGAYGMEIVEAAEQAGAFVQVPTLTECEIMARKWLDEQIGSFTDAEERRNGIEHLGATIFALLSPAQGRKA